MSNTVKMVGTCLKMSQWTVVSKGFVRSYLHIRSDIFQPGCLKCHKQKSVFNQSIRYSSLIRRNSVLLARCKYKNNMLLLQASDSKCSMLSSDLVLNTKRCLSSKQILESSPPRIQPYLRLLRFDKPIGTYLLFWPCSWSIALSAQAGHLPDLYMLALFGLGSFVMRGAACIINDMWDRDIDRKQRTEDTQYANVGYQVVRTKMRPLASGELSLLQALVFLGGNLTMALIVLLQLNWYSVVLGASSMFLVILYPLAKHYTSWPQLILGVTLNWGVLVSWSGIHGALGWPVLPLYIACVLYTMFYDTVYSHQDKHDDMLIGVKSTALLFADKTKQWLKGFSVLITGCLSWSGYLCDQTWPFYTAVTLTAAHLFHQMYTVNLNNPDDCLQKFKSNHNLGAIMFIGIVFGTLLKGQNEISNVKELDSKCLET